MEDGKRKFCEVCGEKLLEDDKFCPNCGNSLSEIHETNEDNNKFLSNYDENISVFCNNCGEQMEESSDKFCQNCGESFENDNEPNKRNKKLIIGVIALIVIITVGGYFAYTNHLTNQYNNNLIEASSSNAISGEMALGTTLNITVGYAIPPSGHEQEYISIVQNLIYNYEDSIFPALNIEIYNLNSAKNSAQTPEEKEYANLLLENAQIRENLYTNLKNSNEITLDNIKIVVEANTAYYPEDFDKLRQRLNNNIEKSDKLSDKGKNLAKQYDRSNNKIKEFLDKHPEFKERLTKLGLSNQYIGDNDLKNYVNKIKDNL